jgi:hypothetical protein
MVYAVAQARALISAREKKCRAPDPGGAPPSDSDLTASKKAAQVVSELAGQEAARRSVEDNTAAAKLGASTTTTTTMTTQSKHDVDGGGSGGGLAFAQSVTLVPYGVLGQQMKLDKTFVQHVPEPCSVDGCCFVDPAGLHHIQPPGGPANAHGAAGAIYKSIGIDKAASFPEDVVKAITRPGDAKYHKYTKNVPRAGADAGTSTSGGVAGAGVEQLDVHVIHTVGPDLRTEPDPVGAPGVQYTRAQAVEALALAYRNVLSEFVHRSNKGQLHTLRLLPVSGGIFAGKFMKDIGPLTMEALTAGFDLLSKNDQVALMMGKSKKNAVQMCIFAEKDLPLFEGAGFVHHHDQRHEMKDVVVITPEQFSQVLATAAEKRKRRYGGGGCSNSDGDGGGSTNNNTAQQQLRYRSVLVKCMFREHAEVKQQQQQQQEEGGEEETKKNKGGLGVGIFVGDNSCAAADSEEVQSSNMRSGRRSKSERSDAIFVTRSEGAAYRAGVLPGDELFAVDGGKEALLLLLLLLFAVV